MSLLIGINPEQPTVRHHTPMRKSLVILETLAVFVGTWPAFWYIVLRSQGLAPDPSLQGRFAQFHGIWHGTPVGDWVLASRWVGVILLIITVLVSVAAMKSDQPKTARLGWIATASQIVILILVWNITEWLIS